MRPKDADGLTNSVVCDDLEQTAPSVGSGSTPFAQTCLLENLGSLRYVSHLFPVEPRRECFPEKVR